MHLYTIMFRGTNMKIKHTFDKKNIKIHRSTYKQMGDTHSDKIDQLIII